MGTARKLAVIAVLALSGCGGSDEPAPKSQPPADATGVSPSTLSALGSADGKVDTGVQSFGDAIGSCTGAGSDPEIGTCVAEKYKPFRASLASLLGQIDKAQREAKGECSRTLESAEDSARELDQAGEELATAFKTAAFDQANENALAGSFKRYRDDMDEALQSCQ